ncbi:MAG: hypothetical protein AAF495_08530 [Pseudomonadota bacterium]
MKPELPHWPRLLTADLAAGYLGICKATFLRDVGKLWPQPVETERRPKRWDRLALDKAVDNLGSMGLDPFLEALDDGDDQTTAH